MAKQRAIRATVSTTPTKGKKRAQGKERQQSSSLFRRRHHVLPGLLCSLVFAAILIKRCLLPVQHPATFIPPQSITIPKHVQHLLLPPISTRIEPQVEWLQSREYGHPVRDVLPSKQVCNSDEDFLKWIKARTYRWFKVPKYLEEQKIWQHQIGADKLGGYLFAKRMGVRVPQILYCTSKGPDALANYTPPANNQGFVVKNLHGHSARNVYVMESGFGGMNRIDRENMTLVDIQQDLKRAKTSDIFIEELIDSGHGNTVPDDYKFYMFDGNVASIRVVRNRGTSRACMAFYDEHWNRQDTFGCFQVINSQNRKVIPKRDAETGCVPITVGDGNVTKSKQLCSDVAPPTSFPEMLRTAKRLSKRIGIFMRIDLFENANQEVVLGEFTPFCSNGMYHCAAKVDADGCVDSCLLGKAWKEHSLTTGEPYEFKEGWERRADGKMVKRPLPRLEGGKTTPVPEYLNGWASLSVSEKCSRIRDL